MWGGQSRDPSPAAPQAGGGDGWVRRAQGEMPGAVGGPRLSQLCASRGVGGSLLSSQADPSHVPPVRELQGLSRSPSSQCTLWDNPPWVSLGEETTPRPALRLSPEPPPLLADPCCSGVGTRQGSGRNLPAPCSPSLPAWCLGGGRLMQPGHLLLGSRRLPAALPGRPPCASVGAKNSPRRQQP